MYLIANVILRTLLLVAGLNSVKDTIYDIERLSRMMSSVIMAYNDKELAIIQRLKHATKMGGDSK